MGKTGSRILCSRVGQTRAEAVHSKDTPVGHQTGLGPSESKFWVVPNPGIQALGLSSLPGGLEEDPQSPGIIFWMHP